jgi:hypothetical protein
MTSDDIIPVLAQILSDNDPINAAAYGNITPGYPATLQDSKLTATNPTAVWIRDLDMTEEGYIGSSGIYKYDILFQIDVMSLTSQAEAESLRRKCKDLLTATVSKLYGPDTFKFGIYLQSRPGTRHDDLISAWVSPLRMRVVGGYVAT